MKLWAQWTALALAALAFVIALIPRNYDERHHASGNLRLYMGRKLLHFPIFWLGLAYFALILCQIFNPAWSYRSSSAGWWLESIEYIKWLPHGIEGTPVGTMNGWRALMIHGAAWLLICSLWIGITRRKTARVILSAVALNGTAIAAVVILQQLAGNGKFLWLGEPPSRYFAATYVYKNHAGAFLLLILALCAGLALWQTKQAKLRLIKSHPGLVFWFLALLTTVAIFLTFARAASALAIVFLAGIALAYIIRHFFRKNGRTLVPVMVIIVLLGAAFWGFSTTDQAQGIWANFEKLLKEDKPFSIGWRQQAIVATTDMAMDDIVRGHGIGGFRYLFPQYQQYYPDIWIGYEWSGPNIVERRLYWEHAHSDYVEFFAESGLLGASLALLTILVCAFGLRQSGLFTQTSLIAMIAGPGLVMLAAMVDFPLHNPAVLFTMLAVIVLAQRWAQLTHRK